MTGLQQSNGLLGLGQPATGFGGLGESSDMWKKKAKFFEGLMKGQIRMYLSAYPRQSLLQQDVFGGPVGSVLPRPLLTQVLSRVRDLANRIPASE